MLIVAWVMSDPVNCELMGRLVMHYVCRHVPSLMTYNEPTGLRLLVRLAGRGR